MKKLIFLFLILVFSSRSIFPCSSAVISGRATPDGRPLLWKHRDAREQENDLRYFQGEKYDFIGMKNTEDTTGTQVWMGSNSAGFSIINTNAYNLDKGGYKGLMDQDGFFMKKALGVCAVLEDFEKYLGDTRGARGVLANFGVIDARGGAAFYEVDPFFYEKYDANDPRTAPSGYLIRTNYAFSGRGPRGGGYIRYQTLENLFYWKNMDRDFTPEFLLLNATRCLKHSVLQIDLECADLPDHEGQTRIIPFRDYIVRGESVSTMVIQGVKSGEDPRLTTLWTIPSFQLSCLTVPVWVAVGDNLPSSVMSREGKPAPLSEKALSLKKKCFPVPAWEGRDYLDLSHVLNKQGTGILQKVRLGDRKIIGRTLELLSQWRMKGFQKSEALEHYQWVDQTVGEFYPAESRIN
jgi:hypothetical protein